MLRGPAANNSFPTLWVLGTKMSCYVICQNVAMEIHQQVQEAALEDCRDAAKYRVKKVPEFSRSK